jgi:fumarylpyruvate hydrolase
MTTAFHPWHPPLLTVAEGPAFPTRRIFCVGRNYVAHAREMGADPDRDLPCFFAKPVDSLWVEDRPVPYPQATAELHHEVELVVALKNTLHRASRDEAIASIFGYAVGLDMTRRDLQRAAKERRWPWALSKGFRGAAPIGTLVRGPKPTGQIWLDVNGERRQDAPLTDVIWSIEEVLVALSSQVILHPGDLVFTGTPAGVAAVGPGDRLHAHVDGLPDLQVTIGPATR